ncbi:MAG: hypothetical protein E7062_08700 [Spirochaetaceae bacterium]|nr:hypothetical protein [Spirochaetaceae bacterium]
MITLIGIKHCGKSTLAAVLAEKKNFFLVDIDSLIEKNVGMSVRSFFSSYGKDAFMQEEVKACKKVLNEYPETTIIASGGGICDNEEALALLKEKTKCIFIDAPEKLIVERIIQKSKEVGSYPAYIAKENPQDDGDVFAIFHPIFLERRQKYLAAADIVFEVKEKTPFAIAEEILEKNLL